MRGSLFAERSLRVLAAVLWAGCGIGQAQQQFYGKTVASIAFEPSNQPIDSRDLAGMQLLQIGEPLDWHQVAGTIDRLFASGLYDDVKVEAEPSGNGVALRFITRARRFIGHVGAIGKISDPPSRGVILSDAQLNLGTRFDEETLETARKNIEDEMHDNGLYRATAGVATIEDPDTHQVTIRFLIDAGKRARYEMPSITGDTKLPNETIVRATGWRIPLIHRWRQVTSAMTDKGVDGIQKKYAKKGRLTANVDLTSLDYNEHTGRAKASFEINAGPRITIRALEAKVSKGKLQGLVPVYVEGSVDNDLLAEGKKNLQDYFQSRGYPDVDVTFKAEPPKNDEEIINYYIATGPRRKLVHIDILGSTYFQVDTLRERMFLQTNSIVLRYGRYSETFRKKDEEAIEDLYRSNGFREVKVTSSVETDYKGKPTDLAVTFRINAGKQWTVSKLTLDGAARLDLSGIQNQLYSVVGQPYADVNVASDRNRILEYYYDHGFQQATFSYTEVPDASTATVDLIYHVKEGPQEFVRKVIVSGLHRTLPSLVQRKIRVREGDAISMTQINDDARRLNDLGIFSNVTTGLQDPDGTTLYKYVLYDLDEAARYSFNVGFGLEVGQFGHTTNNLAEAGGAKGLAPIISFDVSRINFLGRGQTVSLQTRYSTLEQRESLSYVVPRFLGSQGRTVTFTILYDRTQDVQTFSSRREEASVQTSQRLNRASTLLLRFSYARVSTGNIVIPALVIPVFLQSVRIGMLSGSYIQDHRDNPADAHRGFWNTLDAGVAGNFFGSQRNFARVLARNATYTSIGHNLVFARQTQIGEIFPFHVAPGTIPNDEVPLPERFFGGGGVSMRGFGDNQAGPRDIGTTNELPMPGISTINCNKLDTSKPQYCPSGFPIGGDALFFNTFELRFPLAGPNISGVLFHDLGNIYTNFGNLSLAYHQPGNIATQPNIHDFDYAAQAAGFGIRYRTPLGPVRVDLAYALNPPVYEGFGTSLTIQELLRCNPNTPAANPTYCMPSRQQLSHFEFFFSIGQAF